MAHIDRRGALRSLAGAGAAAALWPVAASAQQGAILARTIPKDGKALPAVGLGSWITFNVGNDRAARDVCAEVIREFFALGGRAIDSSPMYGSSEQVIGHGLNKLGAPRDLFSASKVWTSSAASGPGQIEQSRQNWGLPEFDLLQVHNLLNWQKHLETLFAMKRQGKLRYVGVTTSHGMRHAEMETVMASQPIDFMQISYSAVDREIESRILPLAAERGIAVIVNRPFRTGELIDAVKRHPLPPFAAEIGCASWAALLLKFTLSHPAVTCVIPATGKPGHLRENMRAAYGPLPDRAMRARITAHVEAL